MWGGQGPLKVLCEAGTQGQARTRDLSMGLSVGQLQVWGPERTGGMERERLDCRVDQQEAEAWGEAGCGDLLIPGRRVSGSTKGTQSWGYPVKEARGSGWDLGGKMTRTQKEELGLSQGGITGARGNSWARLMGASGWLGKFYFLTCVEFKGVCLMETH